MIRTNEVVKGMVQIQMDRLRANVKALQSTDQCGNPDSQVTQLISRLMIDGSPKAKEDVCAKLDEQARQIVVRDQIITELKDQLLAIQDELYNQQCITLSNSASTWLNREPGDDNGDYARGIRP